MLGVFNFVAFILFLAQLNAAQEESTRFNELEDAEEQLFRQFIKRQRKEHLKAIKEFQHVASFEKQYQVINLLAEKIFTLIQDSRAVIEASPFIPGVTEFPLDDKVRMALTSIIESTTMFSEIVLRFPDATPAVLKTNNNWNVLLQWGIGYCYLVKYLLDDKTIELLNLASQELNIIPRESNYSNPYRKVTPTTIPQPAVTAPKKKKKKKLRKGPKLSIFGDL